MIQCNEINQNINYLLSAFEACKVPKAEDMQLLVELIAAVNTCSNGGPNYDTLVTEVYQPIIDEVVTYPINTYHSISVMILEGNLTRTIGTETITFPTGTVLDHEVTTLNQYEYSFTVKAGANVVVEYLIETIIP
jgi:hypothetical protein